MDMKLLSATRTNLVSRPPSSMCTAGQTKWQLMIRESPQRHERTLVTLLQEIFQETVNLWTTMRGFLNNKETNDANIFVISCICDCTSWGFYPLGKPAELTAQYLILNLKS